jgi:hypothetical protein
MFMRLVALTEFNYGDRDLKVGDTFEASSAEDARLLKGFGKAKDAPAVKRSYQRRDMVAEGNNQ